MSVFKKVGMTFILLVLGCGVSFGVVAANEVTVDLWQTEYRRKEEQKIQ